MQVNPHSLLQEDGPHSDAVVSCRVRLARNLAGFPFVNRASNAQRGELIKMAKNVLLGCGIDPKMIWVELQKSTEHDRQLLVERHLISKPHADLDIPRGVAISGDESISIMVNEEDHLRMQILAPGLQLEQSFERINQIDDAVEARFDYAYSRRWGYLTACPTNVGTGIRLSVMMHIPALKITNELERVRRAAKELHLAVRGYYGEGSESAGDFYQISNQVTLGRNEHELLDEFHRCILPQIVEYERQARQMLLKRKCSLLDDRVHRALGVLRSARLLGVDESMKLLSRVRLGIYTGRVADIPAAVINRLFLHIQPAHLLQQFPASGNVENLREARAALVRQALR